MHDDLGDRMETFYESRAKVFLPRRAYTIIRVDGKAFHSYTRGLVEPFDLGLVEDMDITAQYLCKNIMGAKFAFVQSDEISILLTDFDNLQTQAWFENNLQKCVSVSASMATRAFNEARLSRIGTLNKWGEFDSRIFQIPSKPEVANYFIWRQQDTVRNSIESMARSLFSHKELDRKNTSEQQEMIFSKGQNWNNLDAKLKRGRLIVKVQFEKDGSMRSKWVSIAPPIFTANQDYLYDLIPDNN